MTAKTAILFFARTPESEAKAKSWSSSKLQNLRLAKALHKHTTQALAASQLPVVISDQNLQRGKTFPEKITNALADFFEQGYEQAIVVGSDCAGLSVEDIRCAQQNFQEGKDTYGSSYDGGVYLFTLSRSDFSEEKLRALPWCTNRLSLALLDNIYENSENEVEELSKKADVDQNLNLPSTQLGQLCISFRKIILSILSFCKYIVTVIEFHTVTRSPALHNKGSPFLLF